MTTIATSGTFQLGGFTVKRLGYGAMQLAGKGVFGPPRDRDEAVAVLREAVESGVDHIDTSDFYGPHITNQIIRDALHPYRDDLVIVTKVGAVRGADASWNPAFSKEALTKAIHDNLRNLGLDTLAVVNLRAMFDVHGPAEGSLEEPLTVLAELKRRGLIRHIGLSNVTSTQIADGRKITDIVCVQNQYNLAQRQDDALIDQLADEGTAYVPFFPLGGFSPLQSSTLSDVATRLGATPMQVALAWLLKRAPHILLIPGTSSRAHLRENLAAADIVLFEDIRRKLDGIVGLGGLGDMAVKIAKAKGADVTVFTTSKQKVAEAGTLGASGVLENDKDALADLEATFDFILSTIPEKHKVDPFVTLLKRDGTYVAVGALAAMPGYDNQAMIMGRKTLAGSLIGSIAETQEILDFCAEHRIAPDVQVIPIQEINHAYKKVKDGDVRFRYVIDIGSLREEMTDA